MRRSVPLAVMAFNAVLTVAAIFALGFQCNGSSMVLNSSQCDRQVRPGAFTLIPALIQRVGSFLGHLRSARCFGRPDNDFSAILLAFPRTHGVE